MKPAGVLLLLALGLAVLAFSPGCATTTPPLVIAGHSLVATESTFEVVNAGMNALHENGGCVDTGQRTGCYSDWLVFKAKFKSAFHIARAAYDSAVAKGDASLEIEAQAVLQGLLGELDSFAALVGMRPDGGA